MDRLVAINLRGVFVSMQHEIELMLETGSGAIVNTSSGAGVKGFKGKAAYAATKHGIIGLTKSAALDYAASNIRINAMRSRPPSCGSAPIKQYSPWVTPCRRWRPDRLTHLKASLMQIIPSSIDTQKGPADWFTGHVYIDAVAAPAGSSTFAAATVHFTPGARTAWHTHPHGRTVFVTEGVGLCQREGGPVEVLRAGDRVFFEPEENHWHGAAPGRFMVHIAMHQNDESGSAVTWGRHVTDEEYAASPTSVA